MKGNRKTKSASPRSKTSPNMKNVFKSNSAPAELGRMSKIPHIKNFLNDLIIGNTYVIKKDNTILVGTLAHFYEGVTLISEITRDQNIFNFMNQNRFSVVPTHFIPKEISSKEEMIEKYINNSLTNFMYRNLTYDNLIKPKNLENKRSFGDFLGHLDDGRINMRDLEFHPFFVNAHVIKGNKDILKKANRAFYITINADNSKPDKNRKGFFDAIYNIEELPNVSEIKNDKHLKKLPYELILNSIKYLR
jgi:hypothetical protein